MKKQTRPTVDQIRFDIEDYLNKRHHAVSWILSKSVLIVSVKRNLSVKVVHGKSIFTPREQIKDITIGQTVVFRILKPETEPSDAVLRWADNIERQSGTRVLIVSSLEEAIEKFSNLTAIGN